MSAIEPVRFSLPPLQSRGKAKRTGQPFNPSQEKGGPNWLVQAFWARFGTAPNCTWNFWVHVSPFLGSCELWVVHVALAIQRILRHLDWPVNFVELSGGCLRCQLQYLKMGSPA